MPSGTTHDRITIFLSLPVFGILWSLTGFGSAAVVTSAFLFGGLMFGPDLDTHSKQYTRWSIFSFLWLPYKVCFAHRSRWSHGLVFGTLFRVIYFVGIITLVSFLVAAVAAGYSGGKVPNLLEFSEVWGSVGDRITTQFGEFIFHLVFVGLWLGAASHTFTDMAGTYIRTGRVKGFF